MVHGRPLTVRQRELACFVDRSCFEIRDQIELARTAVDDLDRLARTLSLPGDTCERVRASLEPLGRFPRLGPELGGRWTGFRFLLGPWRWMLLVYVFDEQRDRVVVVTSQDARTSDATTAG